MKPLEKVAAFFIIIGIERGRSIIALMDSDEIKAVVPEIRNLTDLSQEIQKSVWTEFKELGYDDKMNSSQVIGIIRLLFNGSKISDKSKRRFF